MHLLEVPSPGSPHTCEDEQDDLTHSRQPAACCVHVSCELASAQRVAPAVGHAAAAEQPPAPPPPPMSVSPLLLLEGEPQPPRRTAARSAGKSLVVIARVYGAARALFPRHTFLPPPGEASV